jgi:hypothetical protein
MTSMNSSSVQSSMMRTSAARQAMVGERSGQNIQQTSRLIVAPHLPKKNVTRIFPLPQRHGQSHEGPKPGVIALCTDLRCGCDTRRGCSCRCRRPGASATPAAQAQRCVSPHKQVSL